jgi:hypothetical protein
MDMSRRRLRAIGDKFAQLRKERSGARDKATLTRGKALEKIKAFKMQMVDQEVEKVVLSTI